MNSTEWTAVTTTKEEKEKILKSSLLLKSESSNSSFFQFSLSPHSLDSLRNTVDITDNGVQAGRQALCTGCTVFSLALSLSLSTTLAKLGTGCDDSAAQ